MNDNFKGDEYMKNAKYKNKEIKLLFDMAEVYLGKKEKKDDLCDYDISYICSVAEQQKILQFFDNIYGNIISAEDKHIYSDKLELINVKKQALFDNLIAIVTEFEQCGIDYFLIKGFVLDNLLFGNNMARDFGDCDIIIDECDFEKANEIMVNNGFCSSLNNQPIPSMEHLECYEIEYFKDITETLGTYDKVHIAFELKEGTSSIKDIYIINMFKKNKTECLINNNRISTFSFNDNFILLCTNAYSNFELEFAVARIRDIMDVKIAYERYFDALDWRYIYEFANRTSFVHKFYALFNLVNYYYPSTIHENIINQFAIDNINYDRTVYQNFEHGWMRDWLVEPIDLMLDRKWHFTEICYQQSCKVYSSHNKNYNNRINIPTITSIDELYNQEYNGVLSERYNFKLNFSCGNTKDKIYFLVKIDNEDADIRSCLLIFDNNRDYSRKTIEFTSHENGLNAQYINYDKSIDIVKQTAREIIFTINKNDYSVLANNGKYICLYIYALKRFYDKVDFAIVNNNKVMDYENPLMLYVVE